MESFNDQREGSLEEGQKDRRQTRTVYKRIKGSQATQWLQIRAQRVRGGSVYLSCLISLSLRICNNFQEWFPDMFFSAC